MTGKDLREKVARRAEHYIPDMVRFLRDMIAIPSESGGEAAVIARIRDELTRLQFDEVKVDGLGNILARMGEGPAVVVFDGHVDTVGVGDRSTWSRDPYLGELADGIIYGRGASDQEGGLAAAEHGVRLPLRHCLESGEGHVEAGHG